jgi:hypothetical protein
VRGDPQSGFLKRLFEGMLAKTEVEYGRFLVGAGWQSLHLICPTNALNSCQIFLAAVATILLHLDLPQPLFCATFRQPVRQAAFNARTQ